MPARLGQPSGWGGLADSGRGPTRGAGWQRADPVHREWRPGTRVPGERRRGARAHESAGGLSARFFLCGGGQRTAQPQARGQREPRADRIAGGRGERHAHRGAEASEPSDHGVRRAGPHRRRGRSGPTDGVRPGHGRGRGIQAAQRLRGLLRLRRKCAADVARCAGDLDVEYRLRQLPGRRQSAVPDDSILHRAARRPGLRPVLRQYLAQQFRHGQVRACALHLRRERRRTRLLRFHWRCRAQPGQCAARVHRSHRPRRAAAAVGAGLSAIALFVYAAGQGRGDRPHVPRQENPGRRDLSRHRLHGRLPHLHLVAEDIPRCEKDACRAAWRRLSRRDDRRSGGEA